MASSPYEVPTTPRGTEHRLPLAEECPNAPLRKSAAPSRKLSAELARTLLFLEPTGASTATEARRLQSLETMLGG